MNFYTPISNHDIFDEFVRVGGNYYSIKPARSSKTEMESNTDYRSILQT